MRLRINFSKQGALRYTGHLDLYKIWERSLRRARLPLAYSQGYHPQPRIHMAAALPLGFSSRAEVMDIWLNEDVTPASVSTALEGAMPPGLKILQVEQVDERAPALQTEVIAAEYEVEISDYSILPLLAEKIDALLKANAIPRERRGKPYDLRPLIELLSQTSSPEVISMRLTARERATGRPEEVLAALGIGLDQTRVVRTKLFFKSPISEQDFPT